jgi:hypothetical protein
MEQSLQLIRTSPHNSLKITHRELNPLLGYSGLLQCSPVVPLSMTIESISKNKAEVSQSSSQASQTHFTQLLV